MKYKTQLLLFIACCIAYNLHAQLYLPKKLKGSGGKYFESIQYIPGDTLFHTKMHGVIDRNKLIAKAYVKQFYMCRYEVSNGDWRKFHKAMVKKHGVVGADKYLPDTLSWYGVLRPYTEKAFDWWYYHMHPGYANYPVVGISWMKAQEYIKWKNEQADSVLQANGIKGYKVMFRLPTMHEFEFVSQHRYNPQWGLLGIKGGFLANFGTVRDSTGYIVISDFNDGYESTGPVDAYNPNNFGIYNIKGNVEEWVSDEYKGFPRSTGFDRFLSVDSTETDTAVHIVMGGSWIDVPYYLFPGVSKSYPPKACSPFTGFRLAMDVVEVK